MVNWLSPAEIARDAEIFSKLIHVMLGLYIWEFFISLPFDWQFFTRKKQFRWPLIVYFINRYSLLFSMVGITVALNVKSQVNCQVLYTFNAIMGNFAIGTASINLCVRTIALWRQSWFIIVPLSLLIMGHWSLLLHGVVLKADWVPGTGCLITDTNTTILAATFIYSMCLDFVVLCLTAWKLASPQSANRSRLMTLIFGDGLIFFIIAFLSNLIATLFMLLNLNPVMSIIANVPACIASSIVAGRVVRRLMSFSTQSPELFASTTQGSTLAFRSNLSQTMRHKTSLKDGVHVHMQTFEQTSDNSDRSYIKFDASGKQTGETVDPEAQVISGDFKRPPY